MSFQVEIVEFERKRLTEKLAQCTEKQVAFFWQVFSGLHCSTVAEIPENKLISAIDLVDRTIKANAK